MTKTKSQSQSLSQSQPPRRKVGLISLGCAKNLVDAEIMLGSLIKDGIEIVNDPSQADALIVNTCSFIDAAQEESVDTILESHTLRESVRPDQALIVSGCLPQRFRDQLPKLMPEVDEFMGIDQVEQVGEIVDGAIARRKARTDSAGANAKTLPAARAPRDKAGRVKSDLAALEKQSPHTHAESHEHPHTEESLRGTPRFGRTAQTLTPPTPPPATPGITVHLRPSYIPHHDTPRFRLTPKHFAYVKIAEGCNHPCSFCIIPRMRGSHRSRAQADIVAEARRLLADGVRELNLISQDSTYYGLDLRPGHSRAIASPAKFQEAARALPAGASSLCSLLQELNDLPGDFWIRLLYTHPAHWTDELIQTIARCPKVARYVDMPLQHIDDAMLERMRRETDSAYIRTLIQRIRAGIPGIALRTTFIVGFPGETETRFRTLLDFIEDTRFERLGIFTYSQEDGTIAGKMAQQVPIKTRQDRRDRAMAVQLKISREIAAAQVGKKLKILVEKSASDRDLDQAQIRSWEHGFARSPLASDHGVSSNAAYAIARSETDAPDIDGRIYVRGNVQPGAFTEATILGHTDYDLIAEARPSRSARKSPRPSRS